MTCRTLTPDDVHSYIALRREMLAEAPWAFAASPEDDVGLDAAYLSQRLTPANAASAYAIVGAFDDSNALVGVVGVMRERHRKMAHRAHIWGVFVTPRARGRAAGGHARAMMHRAIDLARSWPGIARVDLSVSERSLEARRLYESMGFTAWGTEPDCSRIDGRSYAEIHMSRAV